MRRILAGFLIGALLCGSAGAAEWYEPYVAVCLKLGLMEGVGEGEFLPNGTVTRAECWAVALRLAGREVSPAPDTWGQMALELEDGSRWSVDCARDWTTAAGMTAPFFLTFDPLAVDAALLERLPKVYGLPEEGEAVSASLLFPDSGNRYAGVLNAYEMDGAAVGDRVLRVAFTPEGAEGLDADLYTVRQTAQPGTWYRDLAWTCCQAGWLDQRTTAGLDAAATRMSMAANLYQAGLPLAPINQVEDIPDAGNIPWLLELYRAGIFQGVDPYGSFHGSSPITRAELAATAVRLAEPPRRLRFTLQEMEYPDYTLTPLLPGCMVGDERMITADRMYLTRYGEDGRLMDTGMLWADGSFHPLDPDIQGCGWTYSPGTPLILLQSGQESGVLDLTGNSMAVPMGAYAVCDITPDGHILLQEELLGELRLLDAAGEVEAVLPDCGADWRNFSDGLAPCLDRDSRLFGYVDAGGAWVLEPQWNGALGFQDGYAVVHRDGRDQVIDRTGTAVLSAPNGSLRGLGGGLFYQYNAAENLLDAAGGGRASPYLSDGAVYANGYLSSYDRILDRAGVPVTPAFDGSASGSVGPVDGDGSAFVILDRRVYRLHFTETP